MFLVVEDGRGGVQTLVRRPPGHARVVARLVGDDRHVVVALLAGGVEHHEGLTFDPLDADPDAKQVVLAASEAMRPLLLLLLLRAAQPVSFHPDSAQRHLSTKHKHTGEVKPRKKNKQQKDNDVRPLTDLSGCCWSRSGCLHNSHAGTR